MNTKEFSAPVVLYEMHSGVLDIQKQTKWNYDYALSL